MSGVLAGRPAGPLRFVCASDGGTFSVLYVYSTLNVGFGPLSDPAVALYVRWSEWGVWLTVAQQKGEVVSAVTASARCMFPRNTQGRGKGQRTLNTACSCCSCALYFLDVDWFVLELPKRMFLRSCPLARRVCEFLSSAFFMGRRECQVSGRKPLRPKRAGWRCPR